MDTPPASPQTLPRLSPYPIGLRLGIVALAAVLRLWRLDLRPPHFDEGVFGLIAEEIQRLGYYPYNPRFYHGPLLHYILFVFKCLLGHNLWALRLPEALAGILTVDWIFRFEKFFGSRACAWTALAMAVSPAFVFFSRFAIQETWLVLFMILAGWGVLGLWCEGVRRYLWAVGMGLSGMMLIKETYLIHVICLLAAVPLASFMETWRSRAVDAPAIGPSPRLWRPQDFAAVMAVALAAIVFFYSGNGLHPEGLRAMASSFAFWAHTASAEHNKPFYYWLQLFLRNEPWAACGLVVGLRYVFPPTPFGLPLRLLATYAFLTLVAYSAIPYKTPWCLPAFAWPFFFLASAAIVEAADHRRRATGPLAFLAGAALTIYSVALALDLNFNRYTDPSEDYVYFQTSDQVSLITGPLRDLAREDPSNYQRRGLVICDHIHPVPWLLADFSRIEYYPKRKHLPDYDADFLIVSEERDPEVEAKVDGDFFKQSFRLRPGMAPITLYLRYSVFSHLMPGREPELRSRTMAR